MDIKLVKTISEIKDEELLFEIKTPSSIYTLSNQVAFNMLATEKNINELQNKMWYVIKHEDQNNAINSNTNQQTFNTNNDYFINKDDIIKLGRVKYATNEICLSDGVNNNENDAM